MKNGLLIQIQQWLTHIRERGSRHFVLLCTEMAALIKKAYDVYKYVIYECPGKKLYIFTEHVS